MSYIKKTRKAKGTPVGAVGRIEDLDGYGVNIDGPAPAALELRGRTPLSVSIPDDSLAAVVGEVVMMEPDFVMAPDGSGNRWYVEKLNVTAARVLCPHCKDREEKRGVLARAHTGELYLVVQCGACNGVLFLEVTPK